MTNDRRFDVVVYGATGFTGGLVAEYLAENGPPGLRWAIAGRNAQKLAAVKDRVSRKNPALASLPILSATASDPASLDALAESTRVVLTTVGPYAKYGEPLVAACVKAGTDYVDITGEPDFVDAMVAKYHETAKAKQIRIVSCCGFDSIPHDLGALFTAQKLAPNDAMTVRGFVRAKGGVSGGTWHSALGAMADLGKKKPSKGGALVRTETKEKKPKRKVSGLPMGIYFERAIEGWAVPMPTIDPVIVLRSARDLDVFGPDFRYGHYMQAKHVTTVAGGLVGVGALALLARAKPTRDLLLKARTPGEGPDEKTRKNGWFQVTFVGETASGKRVLTRVSGGEPGYAETSKMIAESALCLALDRAKLPARYGCLTPASAMGDQLRPRLQGAGMRFDVLSTE